MASTPAKQTSHPGLLEFAEHRAESAQNRIADTITSFAGSMKFVYVHIAWFGLWIAFSPDKYPFPLLTMIVSLEAIFLSTFVMISQNRQDQARVHLANQEWDLVKNEEKQNEQLIDLTNKILELTTAIHELTKAHTSAS